MTNRKQASWKIGDNSGHRRHENPLKVKRRLKGPLALGDRVHIVFDDEYVRCKCTTAEEADYIVAGIGFENSDDESRAMATVTLMREMEGPKV